MQRGPVSQPLGYLIVLEMEKLMRFIILFLSLLVLTGCGKSVYTLRSIPGPSGAKGDTGMQGTPGVNGQEGAVGQPGTAGANGQDGRDASGVTTVQFCPSQGPTTHGHFPEQGLCVADKLYAVYWDKPGLNAWLAEIVPGTYGSTATGLSCTFVVSPGCVVSQ